MIRRLWRRWTGPPVINESRLTTRAIFILIALCAWHGSRRMITGGLALVIASFLIESWLSDFKVWIHARPRRSGDDPDDEEAKTLAPSAPPEKDEVRCS